MAVQKRLAYLLVALLVLDAMVVQGSDHGSSSLRKNKGLRAGKDACGKTVNKHVAIIDSPQILVKSKSKKCPCGEVVPSHQTLNFTRSYSTIGTCCASIDCDTNTTKYIDTVKTTSFSVEVVSNHKTSYTVLTNTTTSQRVLSHLVAHTRRLSVRYVTLTVLTSKLVWVDDISCTNTTVYTVSSRSQCVQILTPTYKLIRTLKPTMTSKRVITGTSGCITMVKRVHETISETKRRTVHCEIPAPSVSVCGCH